MISQCTITVLSENRVVNPLLIAEQGLSLHIRTPEGDFLFDTGQMDSFLHNARHLNLDLLQVNKIFLSHGHYDHCGGLYYFLKTYQQADVVAHPNIFQKKYRGVNGERLDIGCPHEEDQLRAMGARFSFSSKPFPITENIISSGEIPRVDDYEMIDEHYQVRVLESYIHDELHDDMSLILKTGKGLIVFLGCGHSGPVNTVKHAMRITQNSHVHAVIGGMHLQNAADEKIRQVANGLRKINPDFIVPLHCTGFRAINLLFNLFGSRLLLFNVGDKFVLD